VSVLEILAHRGEAGVSEVAADIGVHKSTAFRLLGALEDRELVEVEELEDGLNAIAAPIRDHTGEVLAALSVSGPV
jgi:DNA-binding IclR family transcriptional regulator